MKKLYTPGNESRLKAYSAMALALTAGATTLDATIVYNDIEDVTVEIGDMYDIDIDGDGTLDFHFRAGTIVSSTSSGVWSFGSVFGLYTSYTVGNSGNQLIGYQGSFYNYGSALDAGVTVGPDGPWLSYPSYSNSAVLASNFYGSTFAAFPGQGEKFLGFKFMVGDNTHYGWMRIVADIDPVFITIMDYAYENAPNKEIETGDEESVAINELTSSEVNIYAFGTLVNIINVANLENANATIYDLSGKQVASAALTSGLNQIDLSNLASGNYLVNITSASGNAAKQVFIQ